MDDAGLYTCQLVKNGIITEERTYNLEVSETEAQIKASYANI